jgi:hypothetical protein
MGWLQEDSPIVALDYDGTLVAYHYHFTEFASQWVGRELPHGYDGSVPFFKHLGVSKDTYRRIKLAYRRGSLKRSVPAFGGAAELTRQVRLRKARVVICTTRPFLSMEDIEADTVHNAKRHSIQFDYMISGEHKYRELKRLVDPSRIVMVLEDQDDMLAQALRLSLPAVRILRRHNEESALEMEHEVDSLEAATELALMRMQARHSDRYLAKERERKRK